MIDNTYRPPTLTGSREWLLAPGSYERVLRGCATNSGGGSLAKLRAQQARALAVTHFCEMLHSPDALALKERV